MQVHDGSGGVLTLGKALGRGGEGEVSAVEEDPTLVAKVLHPERRRRSKHDKIQAMLQRPPQGAYDAVDGFPVLAWPRALLYSSARAGPDTFIGYSMTRIQPRDFVPLYQITTARRRERLGGEPVTWDRLLVLGARLCHVVRTLHSFGYAVGDLNDRNILVSRRFTPLLMDTDSFQVPRRVGHFPSMVGDQLYWPPELLGVDLSTHRKSRVEGDRYALATLLFQLFMDGNRPYQARGTAVEGLETLMEKTQAGLFPWADPVPGVLEPPAGAPSLSSLPEPIVRGFVRCFVQGHKDPKRRPTADWWHRELAKLVQKGFQACTSDARHVFQAGAPACPWCDASRDPFQPAARRRPATPRKKVPGGATAPTAAAARSKAGATARTRGTTKKRAATKKPASSAKKTAAPSQGSATAKGPSAAKASATRQAASARSTRKSAGARSTRKTSATSGPKRTAKTPAAPRGKARSSAKKTPKKSTSTRTPAAANARSPAKRARTPARGGSAPASGNGAATPRAARRAGATAKVAAKPAAAGAGRRGTQPRSGPRTGRGQAGATPPANVAARFVGPAWAAAVLLALLAPFVWLWRPGDVEKHVVAATLSIAAASVPAVVWAWRAPHRLRRAGVACAWVLGVAWAVGALAASGAWRGLEAAAGAACLVAAGLVFVRLERRRGPMRQLHARSLLHAIAGLPVAYLPLLAWGAWHALH